ncbi:lipoprotein [Intrasporangium oryzae NRRL B-24470]|uniref:Lipoprotein n=1 Tax=Intrasporangium oryzae NRRL B-24470 TaxID=1386089 RepID=W9GEH2_9MICO|nr:GNAT family N-acetyltransferase [Intrasporangium oryzae]EWT02274.1 lipoprotein [Intrasporangium oryzae NRRL B-24470]
MEILTVDRTDDALLASLHAVVERSDAASRIEPDRRTVREFVRDMRFSFPGEHDEAAVALVDGRPAGMVRIWFPDRDNLDKSWCMLKVDPDHRARGVGSALVRWMEDSARAQDRKVLLAEVFVPVGQREDHPAGRFALDRGYTVSSIDIVRRLTLPVDEDVLAGHETRSRAAMGDAYEISVHVDGVPEELRQGVCDASNRLILDAPTGDVEFEPESMTPQDYETRLGFLRDIGVTKLTAVAVHRATGTVAAYTDLCLPPGDPDVVDQWGTLVLPEHRGHRLGMAVKVANLRALAAHDPRRAHVRTMNDEQNPWMVQINKDLGFQVVEEALALKKDL